MARRLKPAYTRAREGESHEEPARKRSQPAEVDMGLKAHPSGWTAGRPEEETEMESGRPGWQDFLRFLKDL